MADPTDRIAAWADPRQLAATVLRRAILVTAIGLSCLLGYFTTYALLALLVAAAIWASLARVGPAPLRELPSRLFAAAFGLLVLSALATGLEPGDLWMLAGFSALLLYAPLAALFGRAATPSNGRKIAEFALFGTAAGLLVAAWFTYVEGVSRAGLGSFFTDPIRLSNTALIIGFFAMTGAAATQGRQRFLYFLGPIMALVVIFASGSRAALIAFPVLLLVAALMLVRHKLKALALSALVLFGFGLVAYLADVAGARSSTLFDILGRLAGGDNPADLGTAIRFILYRAGWSAFLEAPLWGHGWSHLMTAIVPYLHAFELTHASLPHLHNDALNFAVAAGVFGLLAYAVLLATPVLCCVLGPRDGQYRIRLYGCSLLSISYLVLGLPDTMLSFPLHNALYVVLTAVLLNYCRDSAIPSEPQA